MSPDVILPVLYDLVVTIAGQTSLKPLLSRTLQRLLYHTSYSAGFISLEYGAEQVRIDAAVGDFELIGLIGKTVKFPQSCEDTHVLFGKYHSCLRLPVDQGGIVVLLAVAPPETKLPLMQMLQPIMANLSRAIMLCQSHDAQVNEARARQDQAEQSLRQSEAIFNSLLELSPVGVGIACDGVMVNANRIYLEMFGYQALGEIAGQSQQEQIAPQCRNTEGILHRGESGTSCETIGLRKDGSQFPMLVSAKRVELPDGERTLSFMIDLSEQKRSEQALQASNEMLNAVIENVPVRVFWKDRESRYLGCNTAFALDAGRNQPKELIGLDDFQLAWREQAELYVADDQRVMDAGIAKLNYDEPQTTLDGEKVWLRTSKVPFRNMADEIVGILGIYKDVTEQKKIDEALRIAAVAFETQDAIMITDTNANIVRVNRAFTAITGYSLADVQGKNPRMMSSGRQDRAFYTKMWQQLLHTGAWAGEIWDKRKNGETYPKWLTITAVVNEQKETSHYVAIFSDITARKRAEEEVFNLAFYDVLTKLPNRRLFLDRLQSALNASARRNDYGAVLFIDLDRFKVLNDTLGHDYGDLLLIEVGARIKTCLREMDTVARYGGDEFVVLIEEISHSKEDAIRRIPPVGEKIREVLAQPYRLREHLHHCSPSIGISLYHGNEESLDALIEHADLAMYQAKKTGRNAVRFFDPLMQQDQSESEMLKRELHCALELKQMHLHYQVQVCRDKRPLGAEAFLRWMHPIHGMIMPDQFIPIAEESGLIIDIDRWVLKNACRQLALWQQSELTRDLTLTVNISAKLFSLPDFVGVVTGILQVCQADPARLKLEISERLAPIDMDRTMEKINSLQNMGVKLSVDNFSTLYSSLSLMRQLSPDRLKLHQDFVQGITQQGHDAQLLQTVIDFARSLDLEIFAPGVETDEQHTCLENYRCDVFQGYLFGRPLPVDEFETLLAARI